MRSQRLDVLRLLAVLLVLGNHMVPAPVEAGALVQAGAALWARGGWVGVDLFFVLSGFLVSGLLFDEHQQRGTISATRFLVRRGFKIYPAFWLLILVTVAVSVTITGEPLALAQVASELLFIQNYGPNLWNHTWSLAVEEHFYLLLVLLLAGLSLRARGRETFRHVPAIFAGIALVSLLLRVMTAWALPFAHKTHLFPSHLRMDSLFTGVFVAYVIRQHRALVSEMVRGRTGKLLGLGVLLLSPAFLFARETTPLLYTAGFSLFALAAALVLVALVGDPPLGNTRLLRLPAYLGARSYSIYLWHMPVAIWLVPRVLSRLGARGIHLPWLGYLALYLSAALGVGVVMAALVELPALRLRERLFSSERAGVSA